MRVHLSRTGPVRDERGAVAVVVGLLVIPFMVICAFVVDFGNAYSQSRAISTGADSAAIAMINEAKVKGDAVQAKTCAAYKAAFDVAYPTAASVKAFVANYAQLNAPYGRTITATDVSTATLTCPVSPTDTVVANVAVDANVPTTLGRVVGLNQVSAGKTAEAIMKVGGKADCGLCLLGTGVHSTQNGDVTVTGGGVAMNGTGTSGPNGIVVSGGQITIQTGYSTQGDPWTPTPIIGPIASDPLGAITMPPTITGLTAKSNICADGPGIYASLSPTGTTCVLSPGMYVIVGGGSNISGQTSITGAGVTLYFTCGSVSVPTPCTTTSPVYDVNWTGQGSLTLTAPTDVACTAALQPTCGIPGMAVLADRAYKGTLGLGGNAGANITGTIYTMSATLAFNGGGSSGSSAWNLNSLVIANDYSFSGNGTAMNVTYNSNQNYQVPPTPTRLTQ